MFRLEKFYPKGFNPRQYWDDKYAKEHIAGKSSAEFRKQEFWPLLEAQLTPEGHYLDAGCGIGGWIIFLKEQGHNVEGIDLAARTVRALTEYDPDLKVQVGSITAIPYPDESFEGVLAIGVLEYVENEVERAVKEVARVVKPGGFFFLEVPIASWLRRFFYLPMKRVEKIVRTAQGKRPVFANYLFDREELKQILTQAGFEVTRQQAHELPEPDSHYGLYIDWPILRGARPYQLNALGLLVKKVCNAISPWAASTGVVMVARKR